MAPNPTIGMAILVGLGLTIGFATWWQSRKALGRFWIRRCMGIRWRRRFPNASKAELREFLDLFAHAFGFNHRQSLCFSPDDRVMEVYRAVYPAGSLADGLELEMLALEVEKRYGVAWDSVWHGDITLGELFGKLIAGRRQKLSGGEAL